jgi:hypothetical protein
MILALLMASVIATAPNADPAAAIPDAATRKAAMACESALAGAPGGELQSISVESVKTAGSQRLLAGRIQVFLKADSPPPGMLAPTHVINAEMDYRCRLQGSKVVEATVGPIAN